jgi:hypothetical protein
MEFTMNKTLAGLGVLALVAVGATGATFPANASSVQPVAEIVAESDAIIASPDAILVQSEPVVTTSPAEPVAVVAEPVVEPVAPVAPAEPVVAPEPVADAPVVPEPVAVVADAPAAPEPVYAEDGSLIENPEEYYSAEQQALMELAIRTRAEGIAWEQAGLLRGYFNPQDAGGVHLPGYVYTPSLVDPSKVHVSTADFVPWNASAPEQVVEQETTPAE